MIFEELTIEEESLENLKEFQEHYLGFRLPFCDNNKLLVSLTEIILKQQEQIEELRQYVEDQKREARLASEDCN